MLPDKKIVHAFHAVKKRLIFNMINFWPPHRGAGIRVRRLDLAGGVVDVEMKLRWWNRNYVGTHFGGSLYSMCDPWFMLILIEHLGAGYTVWDKAATIRFRKPGRKLVRARFEITEDEIERIREEATRQGKSEPRFVVRVIDVDDQVIAEVEKLVHVKREKAKRRRP
jgi:acyl-coenzyme A thioesterase PaaI-like protein